MITVGSLTTGNAILDTVNFVHVLRRDSHQTWLNAWLAVFHDQRQHSAS